MLEFPTLASNHFFLTLCFTAPAFSEEVATMHQVCMEFFKND